jgi:hypothetical protein
LNFSIFRQIFVNINGLSRKYFVTALPVKVLGGADPTVEGESEGGEEERGGENK